MAVTLAKSTYQQLTDDLISDLNEDVRLSALSPESFQRWVLEAEKQLCDKIEIRERYTLGLNVGITEYQFQDRPAITAATNATPPVITAASHGLADNDKVFISGVLGNTVCNGRRRVNTATSNTFELQLYANIDGAEAGDTTVTVTTKEAYEFATGSTVIISGVSGMTDLNSTFVITVVDSTNFTVPLTTTQEYTSGGIIVQNVVGSGAYTTGGRFWRDDEIPTYFKRFITGERLWGTVKREIKFVDLDRLLEIERIDTEVYRVRIDYNSPVVACEWIEDGGRYLKFYPEPIDDHNATLYGRIKITPREFYADPVTANIHLASDYDEAIKLFMKYKAYQWLKEFKLADRVYAEFLEETGSLRGSFPRVLQQRIVYR